MMDVVVHCLYFWDLADTGNVICTSSFFVSFMPSSASALVLDRS